ncbi:PLC-E [Ramaria rubella]|nr:PLC-E [Ramaria rubella]
MQENRAFDHYFGTMAGIRGFADPNVHIARNGQPTWFQQVNGSFSNATTALLPFWINAEGGNLTNATQCMEGGSNGWTPNHNAFADGDNNLWVLENSPYSWGHFKRQDIPTHFALAEGWTVADMYAQSVLASTIPNRVFWATGSVNVPGGPQTPDQGGVTIDNNKVPGCEGVDLNCFPMSWKMFPEFLEEANVTWQIYQDVDNFGENPMAWFDQFINAANDSSLAQRGLSFLGLQAFHDAAAAGTLPQVSYLMGLMELSEHPPWTPRDGGWFQQQIVNSIINSPSYNSTVLMLSYDESGGWGDHVLPITAPPNTPGEWMTNPFDTSETVFAGPGFRLPFYVISPWTRGGNVFTAPSDHSSQIMFMDVVPTITFFLKEKWLASKGKNVVTDQLNSWRREHMSDLVQMFDFAHPDFSLPDLPVPPLPLMNSQGQFIGSSVCQAMFPNPQPPIPYGQQTRETSLSIEDGFKASYFTVRGALTEGRYLIFESNRKALALSTDGKGLSVGLATPSHDVPSHRFVLHATADPPATTFTLQFAGTTVGFVDSQTRLTVSSKEAAVFNITDLGSGKGYIVQEVPGGRFLSMSANGGDVLLGDKSFAFQIFSVTKSTDSGKGF